MLMSSERKKRKRPASQLLGIGTGTGDGGGGAGELYFKGIAAYFVETGIQPRRLQVNKHSLSFPHSQWDLWEFR